MNAPLIPGGRYDEAAAFAPIKVAVLTISDTRDEESDTSGHVLVERLTGAGHQLADKAIVRDDIGEIRAQVKAWTGSGEVDVILSTGGTGLTGRDVTPEAIEPLLDKLIEDNEPAYLEQWHSLSEDYHSKMVAMIVGFELEIIELQCKLKLNQHRPESHAALRRALAAGSADERELLNWMDRLRM